MKTAIQPTRQEDYPEWYQQVIKHADLAENSPVRGCMVIKPWGYALWENIQKILDQAFKDTGHQNAYFPLFIPKSYLEKEAAHVEGFAKECAVVTHSRLEDDGKGGLQPASPLDEPLIIRPTSETIIGETFSKWVQSYRDLPLLINQWANVVRWEMRTRLFLRTTEFLWQEGHTAHETAEEAVIETKQMLKVYTDFVQNYLAIPVIQGEKTENERFPGAVNTYCIEAMMQDKKALQAGTSHFLGQNFAKASGIQFLGRSGNVEHAWTTSWGVSTRLIGGIIMTHSDDNGFILPPKIAPAHIAILPVLRGNPDQDTPVLSYCRELKKSLEACLFSGEKVRVELDSRDIRAGEKAWHWVKRGVPIRLEIGARDIEKGELCVYFRKQDQEDPKEKHFYNQEVFLKQLPALLEGLQADLFEAAQKRLQNNLKDINTPEAFYAFFQTGPGGFARVYWNGDSALEGKLKEELKVTIRCIPLETEKEQGPCLFTGKSGGKRVIFAKAY